MGVKSLMINDGVVGVGYWGPDFNQNNNSVIDMIHKLIPKGAKRLK